MLLSFHIADTTDFINIFQVMLTMFTQAEVEESEKPIPASLTTQATDLGEEEQVNDACDVRPTATCLTLHAQEALFVPLHTALSIWDKLSMKVSSWVLIILTCLNFL